MGDWNRVVTMGMLQHGQILQDVKKIKIMPDCLVSEDGRNELLSAEMRKTIRERENWGGRQSGVLLGQTIFKHFIRY